MDCVRIPLYKCGVSFSMVKSVKKTVLKSKENSLQGKTAAVQAVELVAVIFGTAAVAAKKSENPAYGWLLNTK